MRTTYATEDVEQLKENPCVFSCTGRFINYTYEFKKRALELHGEGITAKEIWLRSGFDVGKWKKSYFRDTLKDWKKIVRKNGLEGLQKHGGIQFDRGPNKTEADKIKRLSLQDENGSLNALSAASYRVSSRI